MQWFYAIDGERLGPISAEQMAVLVARGTVTAATLVWREGFADWQAWGEVAAENPLPEASADAPEPAAIPLTEAEAEMGSEIDWSVDEFTENLQTNGFATSVGGCLTRAWENYKSFFGLALGAVLVAYLLAMVGGMLPVVGMLSGILITPHINAGVAWIFLKRARGEEVEFSDVFAGFSRCYAKLAVVGLVQFVAMITMVVAFMVPMMLLGVSLEGLESGTPPEVSPGAGAGMMGLMLFMMAVMIYFTARFFVANIIAVDRPDTAINAYRLSWRITQGRFWTIFGLMLVLMLLGMAGVLALFIGLIFVAPLYGAVIAQIYHDACESAAGRPPE